MPTYYSYIARLDTPGFFWNDIPDEKYRLGNTPGSQIIPQDYGDLGYSPGYIGYWSKKAGFEGKQIDWGAWGMVLRKSELDDDQTYILVVAENP
jgi:hypothetical protein